MGPVWFSKNVVECELSVDNNIGFSVRHFLSGYGHWSICKIVKNRKDKRSRDSGEKDRIVQGGVGWLNLCGQIRIVSLLPYRTNCFSFDNSGGGFAEILHLGEND